MNYKLTKLALEADLRFAIMHPQVEFVDGTVVALEKFAELIIKECARIARQYADEASECRKEPYASGARVAAFTFLQEFGIQEFGIQE